MTPALIEFHPFPKNGAQYQEYEQGRYYVILENGDEVAVYVTNHSEMFEDDYGERHWQEWVTFEDWMGKEVSQSDIAKIALIRLD